MRDAKFEWRSCNRPSEITSPTMAVDPWWTGRHVHLLFEVQGTPCVVSPYFLGLEIKTVATGCQILRLKFTKFKVRLGLRPRTQWRRSLPCFPKWRCGSVVRTSVFKWQTFHDLRLIYGWHVTTSWVRCPLWVNQPGQLSLSSLRGQ